MKCENCGENEANVKYTQIVNGEKKQMFLCEECSKKLGIGDMQFSMPIDFSSFLGDFFSDFNEEAFIPTLEPIRKLQCKNCGLLFDDFLHTGKFGCSECYTQFENMIDPIFENIQSSNRHVGRIGKVLQDITNNEEKSSRKDKEQNLESTSKEHSEDLSRKSAKLANKDDGEKEQKQLDKIEQLKQELKQAIAEERYEDAAKLRDKIKDIE